MTPTAFGFNLLTQSMTVAALRHRVIANNIANVNTPNYKAMEVTFEDELSKHLGQPATVKPVVTESDGPERVDGNNVDIDKEINAMTKNSLLYQAASQILASRVGSLRSAISGR
ncbi:flagellar basal body rod protein FlgB [Limnoglobus roseus]|uniref:Flagellar basal body rod protein FlgB n=1 Tax=Limnoglobus roseus TaxID=2598579 RepID=A0A5C1A669_9BACT|nr:flagellar basal body protein [Limnoglobus roseus]QEL13332.1 flagellar biosynthesis protein FlgB [Limnoglobus roseus]